MAKGALKKEDIIKKIIDMRLKECYSNMAILDYLQNELGYGTTQSYEYIKMAKEVIRENYDANRPEAINEAVGQYEEMIRLAKKEGNLKVWNDLKKELNKLQGLYTEKIDITSGGDKITEIKLIQVKSKDDLYGES